MKDACVPHKNMHKDQSVSQMSFIHKIKLKKYSLPDMKQFCNKNAYQVRQVEITFMQTNPVKFTETIVYFICMLQLPYCYYDCIGFPKPFFMLLVKQLIILEVVDKLKIIDVLFSVFYSFSWSYQLFNCASKEYSGSNLNSYSNRNKCVPSTQQYIL